MKYVIQYHGPNAPERITVADPHTGIKLDRDEARMVIRDVAEFLEIVEPEAGRTA